MVHAGALTGHTDHHHIAVQLIACCRGNSGKPTKGIFTSIITSHQHDRPIGLH